MRAVPRETWAIMKQASFEPNTVSPRRTQPCSEGRLARRSSPSPHCFPGGAASAPLTRRRRRPPGPSRGSDAGARALEPGQRERTLPEPGRVDGGPPLGHTPESSEQLSETRPDLWPRQMGLTEHPGGPWGPRTPRRLRVVLTCGPDTDPC